MARIIQGIKERDGEFRVIYSGTRWQGAVDGTWDYASEQGILNFHYNYNDMLDCMDLFNNSEYSTYSILALGKYLREFKVADDHQLIEMIYYANKDLI